MLALLLYGGRAGFARARRRADSSPVLPGAQAAADMPQGDAEPSVTGLEIERELQQILAQQGMSISRQPDARTTLR